MKLRDETSPCQSHRCALRKFAKDSPDLSLDLMATDPKRKRAFRLGGISLAALAIAACSRSDNASRDSTAADTTTVESVSSGTVTSAEGPASVPAAGSIQAGGSPGGQSVGAAHDVRMIGDAQGFRFEPASITVSAGDVVRFIVVAGGPHNVTFDAANVPSNMQNQLNQNIAERMGPLSSALATEPGEAITISFAGIQPGQYPYFCSPHAALGMRGQITIQ